MTAIPRYRAQGGPAILSAGFRPFFLCAALWAALVVPLWLALFAGAAAVPTALPPAVWHVHEMVFGYGAAVVAGFLLTAIPNWTGRMPLQGGPLAFLVLLWGMGRVAVLCSAKIGFETAAVFDLAFPLSFLAVVAREILAGRNWRNLPMLAALALLLLSNLLVHLDVMGVVLASQLGDRLGVATLLMLISFVGGRIVPSFARNWLAKERPEIPAPAPFNMFDRIVLATTAAALALWVAAPDSTVAHCLELVAGVALGVRLALARASNVARASPVRPSPRLWLAGARRRASGDRRFHSAAARDNGPPCAHGWSHRHDDPCRDDPRFARPHRAAAYRGARHNGNLRADHARRDIAPCSAIGWGRVSARAVPGRDGMERRFRPVRAALCQTAVAASPSLTRRAGTCRNKTMGKFAPASR
jgi:NnrS protein